MIRSSAADRIRGVAAVLIVAYACVPSAASAISCTVSTLPANFGVYNPVLPTAATTTGEVDVACTCSGLECVAFGYRIEIAAGNSGNVAVREMQTGNARLRYNLYSDASFTTVWGTGSAGLSMIYLVPLFGSKQAAPVYARMPAGQAAVVGTYSDTPMVTITY